MKTITLANLKDSTAQEVFDFVAHHLLTQNEKCMLNDLKCAYRNSDGLKCAVGCVIANDEYSPIFDECVNSSIAYLVKEEKIKIDKHLELLQRLQKIHDQFPALLWESQLINLAESEKLDTSILNNL
jgi:hypothetical protein